MSLMVKNKFLMKISGRQLTAKNQQIKRKMALDQLKMFSLIVFNVSQNRCITLSGIEVTNDAVVLISKTNL